MLMYSPIIIIGAGAAGSQAAVSTSLPTIVLHDARNGGAMSEKIKYSNEDGKLFPELNHNKKFKWTEYRDIQEQKADSKGNVQYVDCKVISIETQNQLVSCESGLQFGYSSLIISSGSTQRKLGVTNEERLREEKKVMTASDISYPKSHNGKLSKEDIDFFQNKSIAIIGSGKVGIKTAAALIENGVKPEQINIIASHQNSDHIKPKDLAKIKGVNFIFDSKGSDYDGQTLTLHSKSTDINHKIESDLVLVATGRNPNTAMLDSQVEINDRGFITVAPDGVSTNISGVYAVGDVTSYKNDKKIGDAISKAKLAASLASEFAAQDQCWIKCQAISAPNDSECTTQFEDLNSCKSLLSGSDSNFDIATEL